MVRLQHRARQQRPFDKKQRQQDIDMSMPPTMVPSSSGSATTSVLPQHQPVVVNEENINMKLNKITINLMLRNNKPYQHASPMLLNFCDNFNSLFFLANCTPIDLNDNPSPSADSADQQLHQQHADFTATPSPASTMWCTWHLQHHQSRQPTCLTSTTTQRCGFTALRSQQHHRQHGPGTTDELDSWTWSHLTTNFRWHQLQRGALSTASFVVRKQHCLSSKTHLGPAITWWTTT